MPNLRITRDSMVSEISAPQHPGRLLNEYYIKPMKIVPSELAKRLGVNPSTLSRLLNEEADLTAEMALKMSWVIGIDATALLYMQADRSLWRARIKIGHSVVVPTASNQTDAGTR